MAKGDNARMGLWGLVAIAWALVIAERWVVHDNGALIIAAASYAGVVLGARAAGIAKKSLVLLAYPLIFVAIIVAAGQDLLDPGAWTGSGSPRSSGPSSACARF